MQRAIETGSPLDELLARFRATRPPDDAASPTPAVEPACGACRDVGFLRRDVPAWHEAFGRPVPCPCGVAELRRRERIWARSGLEGSLAEARFETYPVTPQTRPVVDRLRSEWLDADPAWLLLLGASGRGKSGLLASALWELVRRGREVRFMTAPDLFDWIRASYDETLGVRESDRLAELRTVDVLAIDDLGQEHATPWVRMRLWTLLNARYAARLRTAVSTNLDELALLDRIGDSAHARIEHACGPDRRFVLRLEGPDLRGDRGLPW